LAAFKRWGWTLVSQLTRRRAITVICVALATPLSAFAGPASVGEAAQDIVVQGADGPIAVKLFAGGQGGKRPAVIILHGRRNIAEWPAPYTHYAEMVAAKGLDAYLVSYYDAMDSAAMASSDRTARVAYFDAHLAVWADRVHDVVSYALARGEASGKVALLGFSNGGFLAVASAAADPRVGALVAFYAGLPERPAAAITHLPPLLALHGDADHDNPLLGSAALVDKAHALGGSAELAVYPGAGHGFDFHPERPDAHAASERALSFLERQLKP
jgi:carboxymethylenebutenolidase